MKQGRRAARAEIEKKQQQKKQADRVRIRLHLDKNSAKEKHKNKKIIKRMKKGMKKGKGQYYILALLRQKGHPRPKERFFTNSEVHSPSYTAT